MKTLPQLQQEFETENRITRSFMELVPEDKFDWKPHEKSMTLKQLAVHLAEIPSWPENIVRHEELNFEDGGYEPTPVEDKEQLLNLFNKSADKGSKALQTAGEADLDRPWVMKSGEQVLMELNKYEAIRHGLNQTTHHRAQLGVYFRLLDIPVPASYGPSADKQDF